MDTKPQIKKEPPEVTETDQSPKKENPSTNNNEEVVLPAKRDCHGNTIVAAVAAEPIPVVSTPVPLQANIFFELFYDGPYDMALVNRSWGIHRVPPPNRAIVLSEIAYALFNVSMSPSYKKQVIFTDNLKFKAFVLDKLVVEKTLDGDNTQEDFEQSFAEIVNMVICRGGPLIEENQEMLARCAYQDFYSNRWRHKSCIIIIEKNEEVCRPCSYLDKYFQEWLKYNSKDK